MFFFFDENEKLESFVETSSRVNKGIFFVKANVPHNPLYECTWIDPQIHWITDFNTIYEQLIIRMGTESLKKICRLYKNLRYEYNEVAIIRHLLDLHKANELEYTKGEIINFSKKFFQILKVSEKNADEGLYKLLQGHQKKKVVFLSLLSTLLFKINQDKIIIFLKNINSALCAVTPYTRTGIVIRFLSFLELAKCPVLIIIPCDNEVFKEYKQMHEWLKSSYEEKPEHKEKAIKQAITTHVPIMRTRCWECALLDSHVINGKSATIYHCPKNRALPERLPPDFAEKCCLFKPKQ